ncbi:hypothetical protein TNCV_1234671 [Trichonephila clavipes]|nr:hypothetical protein TNCV_1234671 [Trichonephila clavipes]
MASTLCHVNNDYLVKTSKTDSVKVSTRLAEMKDNTESQGFSDLSEQQEALMVEVTIPNCYKQAIRDPETHLNGMMQWIKKLTANIVDDYLESEGNCAYGVSSRFPPPATLIELEIALQEEWQLLNSAVVLPPN